LQKKTLTAIFLFHIFVWGGFVFLPRRRILPFLVAILFKIFEKNVNKKSFPTAGRIFLMVCLLLTTAGIHAARGRVDFRTAGFR
jgi:hypothetical protein